MTSTVNFPALVYRRALDQGERTACRFFKGAAREPVVLTFGELWRQSAMLAGRLRAHALENERVLLLCVSQQTFVVAFYACLIAGVVAVPAAPPRRRHLDRLRLMVRDCGASAVLFDIDYMDEWDGMADAPPLRRIDLRKPAGDCQTWGECAPCVPAPDAAAFLQYTSGSTGDPKGVVVTHGNLMSNCKAIAEGMEITEESSLFTALPLFHDMGLVGGVLQMMYSGCVAGFMSPAEFVQYPERWLGILSDWRVTVSGGPNFMFDLAARVDPAMLAGVDLSAWRVAFCGAEPIRAGSFHRFAGAMKPFAFRASAFFPCYGMAESTLFITGAEVGGDTSVLQVQGQPVVGCGRPRGDTRIAIVDPATGKRVEEGMTGEIWVSGSSVAAGYWARPVQTRETFAAIIAGEGDVHYLRTGDLGFLHGGELYVAGRLKDLVIVNGRKYAPQDIEAVVESAHEALRDGASAAFAVTGAGTERLVVVAELHREWWRKDGAREDVVAAGCSAVMAAFGLPLADINLIRPGSLPRTSSGKVRRSACRQAYETSSLDLAAEGVTA